MIVEITFEEILNVWVNYLWVDRKSPIEPNSAMLYLEGYDLKNFDYNPTFYGYYVDGILAGVNSGHMCCDKSYRSRGLYVFPEYRNKGIATLLLSETIFKGSKENASFVWSLPRKESWKAYENAGFELTSDWVNTETGINAYCRIDLGTKI